MLRTARWIGLVWCGIPVLAASSFGQSPANRPGMPVMRPLMRGTSPQVVTRPTAEPASVPAAPVTLSNLPSVPPQVSYQGGMLTIVAQNSSLGDILREVHRSTGATIDVPPNATERVVTRLGPGPARDVLADLLNGSAFNYVMLGSAADPSALASVMLTMKPAGGVSTQNEASVYQPVQQPFIQQQPMPLGAGPGGQVVQQPASDDEADAEEEKDEDDSGEEGETADQAQNGADGAQPNAGPKTPEQILEMLRQRQGQMVPGQQVIPPPTPQLPQPDNN